MGGFKVDTEAVRSLGTQLSKICADLSAAAAPSDLSDAAAGSRAVGQALREFHDHWKDEQGKLQENLQKLATAISGAADNYESSDNAVARASGEGTAG